MSSTPAEQQRIAFQFLANRARVAHREGDGVLVNHLCATALSQLSDHLKAGTLLLPVREIAWMLILPQFWLIDEFLLDTVANEIKHLKPASPPEEELQAILRRYHRLVERPLDTGAPKISLADSKLMWLAPEYRVEDEVLLQHVIELTWIRGTKGPAWAELLSTWLRVGPEWLKASLTKLSDRLHYQTALVEFQTSASTKPVVPTEAAWLARLWDATLDCEWKVIDEVLAQQVPRTGIDSPLSRFLFDFRHFNRLNGVWGDDQATGLTRRRVTVTSFPKLTFDDLRASRCADAFASGIRKSTHEGLGPLMHAHRLAMLSEVEALRLWDFFGWTQAIKAQSRALMEQAKRHPECLDFGFPALQLALQSLSYDKTPGIQATIRALDFGSPKERREFFERLFCARDLYAYPMLQVFHDFADSIPAESWHGLADWSIKFVHLAATKQLRGSKSIPLAFWRFIFPFVPRDHDLWARMLPEVAREATVPLKWQSDEGLIRAFTLHAPETHAASVIRTMIAIDDGGAGDKRFRWESIAATLQRRSELRDEFSAWAVAAAPGASHRYRFLADCDARPDKAMEDEARSEIRNKIEEFVEAAKVTNPKQTAYRTFLVRTPIVVTWHHTDADFLGWLFDMIDGKHIRNQEIPPIILFAEQIAANGPDEFVAELAKRLEKWLETPPGAVAGNETTLPWANTAEEIAAEVAANLAEALNVVARRAGVANASLIETGVRQLMDRLPIGAPEITRLLLRLAQEAQPPARAEKLAAVRVVLAVTWGMTDDEREQRVANVVQEIAWFVRKGLGEGNRVRITDEFARQLVGGLDPLWTAFCRSPSANLRQSVALLLSELEHRQIITPNLVHSLIALRGDVRGRVRSAAERR